MAYRDQLYPWCIVRSAPNAPPTVLARFRRPADAEAHLKILRQTTPGAALSVVFDKLSMEVAAEAEAETPVPEPAIEPTQPEGSTP